MTELERMCVELERHINGVQTELVQTMAAFRTILQSLTEVVKERDDLWLALQNAKGDRDAALKLVDDTLAALGGVDPGEIAHISATERDQLAALNRAIARGASP